MDKRQFTGFYREKKMPNLLRKKGKQGKMAIHHLDEKPRNGWIPINVRKGRHLSKKENNS